MRELNELHDTKYWSAVLNFLPTTLESTAHNHKIFLRKREIRSAKDLLRMLLAYSVSDLSLQSICVWAEALGITSISKPAFFYKVRDSAEWLISLLTYVLNLRNSLREERRDLVKVKIVDATHIEGPGATGSEWRIHAQIAVDRSGKRWYMENLQITDELVGESYGVHLLKNEEIVIGDRVYGIANSIFYAKEQGAYAIARISPYSIRICKLSQEIIKIIDFEKDVPQSGIFSRNVLIPVPPKKDTKSNKVWTLEKARDWILVRLIGCRNKKGEVVWVITTVPKSLIDDKTIMQFYRIRWQIELLFKRLKSIGWLDKLPSPHKGPTALSWIAGRLLGAALVEAMNDQANTSFPP